MNYQDNSVIAYENIMAEYGFTRCICDVTRREIVMNKLVESCLDHIYVRAPLSLIDSAVIKHKVSDHYYISAAIQWKRTPAGDGAARSNHEPPRPAARRVLNNRLVREKLLSTNFEDLMEIECPIKLYESFTNIFTNVYNECYKMQDISVNKSNRNMKGWITENLKIMIQKRDRLFNIWCNEPKNMINRLNYTKYRNKCSKAIFKSKVEYDKKSILDCNKNIKKIWDKINSLLGNEKQSIDNLILTNMGNKGSPKYIL